MPIAVNPADCVTLQETLSEIAGAFFSRSYFSANADEIVSMFAEAGDHELLRAHAELTQVRHAAGPLHSFSHSANVGLAPLVPEPAHVNIQVHLLERLHVLLPAARAAGFVNSCPVPLLERFQGWLDERVHAGVLFGVVNAQLSFMRDSKLGVATAPFLMPCLPRLFQKSAAKYGDNTMTGKSLRRKAKIMSEVRKPGYMPALDPELRKIFTLAGNLVNAVAMTEDAAPATPSGPATFRVTGGTRVGDLETEYSGKKYWSPVNCL